MHRLVVAARPNAAHYAISQLQQRVSEDCWVCVLTQNVDGFHSKAGTESLIEAHGSLRRLRCTQCDIKPWNIENELGDSPPNCPNCGQFARFDIVLFEEAVDPMLGLKALAFIGDCQLFIAVGTSGLVAPVSQMIEIAKEAGARTVLVDTDPKDPRFDELHTGKAEELLPLLLGSNP